MVVHCSRQSCLQNVVRFRIEDFSYQSNTTVQKGILFKIVQRPDFYLTLMVDAPNDSHKTERKKVDHNQWGVYQQSALVPGVRITSGGISSGRVHQ